MHKVQSYFSLCRHGIRASATVVAILSLLACGNGNKPSDAEIQQALTAHAAEETGSGVKVLSVTKLNGAFKEEQGVYEAEYQAEIEFELPIKVEENQSGRGFEKFQNAQDNTLENGTADIDSVSTSYFAPTYKTNIRGVAFLVKNDNGWQVPWNMITKIYWPDRPEGDRWQTF